MALLLAMYQKMRLIREKNQATLDLTKFTSKYDRVSKNIERVQKRYTSLFAQLDSQAKQMQSQAKMFFQNAYGLGGGYINDYMNPSSFGGMNGFVNGCMQKLLADGIPYKDKDGNKQSQIIDSARYQEMLAEYMQKGDFEKAYTREGAEKELVKDSNGNPTYVNGWSYEEVQAFGVALQQARMSQQQAQMQCSNMSQAYDNNVSIWLDAAKAQLEAEQDAALEPLNYQQTMWELEKEQAEQKLTRIKANLESYTQLCSEEAKDQAPKFGLG